MTTPEEFAERDHQDVAAYYDQQLAAYPEATGAGMIWFLGKDHLSPALSNDDTYALDSTRWREATSRRVLDLAQRMGMTAGQTAIELGSGIGGPGRDIALATGARVLGLSVSLEQLKSSQRISANVGSNYTDMIKGDMQRLPVASDSLDHVYSINAIYHVNEPHRVINEAFRALKPGGKFGVDDWFVTEQTPPEVLSHLRNNWSTSKNGFHDFNRFVLNGIAAGFAVKEITDYTEEAGAFISEERFGKTYDKQLALKLRAIFPQLYNYDGYQPGHADLAVSQLRSDILHMGKLYRDGHAYYRQVVFEKPERPDLNLVSDVATSVNSAA